LKPASRKLAENCALKASVNRKLPSISMPEISDSPGVGHGADEAVVDAVAVAVVPTEPGICMSW
jgi:hypothetical protein